jgi:hypothetical protein
MLWESGFHEKGRSDECCGLLIEFGRLNLC